MGLFGTTVDPLFTPTSLFPHGGCLQIVAYTEIMAQLSQGWNEGEGGGVPVVTFQDLTAAAAFGMMLFALTQDWDPAFTPFPCRCRQFGASNGPSRV